ncbi:hypothetical protein [Falsigemmobacter faecalis]|uniref:GIY-YIG domain-containing protein n=1 Tax=Falsigemmobacter faecalis TaxID=2488730 RepID=A0A3P3DT22_9RHOB|nr:hypothetical protein [Falsigemmobacter faecalis]RRH77369.1 hypothetical protein EG244_04030 [Falsigemmobacter faecalis]
MPHSREKDLERFYDLLARLPCLPFPAALAVAPPQGVYFVFEPGEQRAKGGLRVTRIGTHGLTPGGRAVLKTRLRQHYGRKTGDGGHHRSSVFRLLTGAALARQAGGDMPAGWGGERPQDTQTQAAEQRLEAEVSTLMARLELRCLPVADPPGQQSLRKVLEAGAIALLSNHGRLPIDPPSAGWLGHHSHAALVRSSGLWNRDHVQRSPDPSFIATLEAVAAQALQPA